MVLCGRAVEVPMLCVLSISLVKQQLVVWLIYLSTLYSSTLLHNRKLCRFVKSVPYITKHSIIRQ